MMHWQEQRGPYDWTLPIARVIVYTNADTPSVRGTDVQLVQPYLLGTLAEAHAHLGQPEEGLHMVAQALSLAHQHSERLWEAELYRLQGEFVLAVPKPLISEAERSFRRALAMARRQRAKSWELRAAVSLARLWQQQDKHQAAYNLLAPVYEWFTEGFDTADLQAARALLDDLEG